MGNLVARVFDVLEVTRLALHVDVVVQQVVEQARAFERVLRASIEEIEEAGILGNQAKSGKHGESSVLV